MVAPEILFRRSAVLVFGLGTTAAMWGAGYLCRLPLVNAPSPLLGAVLLLILPGGALLAARETRLWTTGIFTGLLASVVNLLILGSFLAHPTDTNSLARSPLVWVPGFLAGGAVLGAIGGLIGARLRPPAVTDNAWGGRLARISAAATLLLVVAGGLVTGEEAGMDVPDWPGSFGYNMFLYPLSRMSGGIYYEHAHRLFGTLVGLCTLVLAVLVARRDESRNARRLAIAAFVLVCVQGLLGGLRVTEDSRGLAVFHAVLGQGIFALLLAVAALTSRTWRGSEPAIVSPRAGTERKLTWALLGVATFQVLLGALVRQLDWGLHLHITVAVVVFGLGLLVGFRLWGFYPEIRPIHRSGLATLVFVNLQVGLGFAALFAAGATEGIPDRPAVDVLVTTAHQAVGALILGAGALAVAWTYRLLAVPEA